MSEQPPSPDQQPDEPEDEARPDGNVGPPEDLEDDPAYDPDDPELKRKKGG